MKLVQVDYEQIRGEVKERNKFYRTIVRIREQALSCCESHEFTPEAKEEFTEIISMCDKALEDVI